MTERQARLIRWAGGAIPLALLMLPFVALVLTLGTLDFPYLEGRTALLLSYWANTLAYLALAGLSAGLVGTAAAWIIYSYRFPLRNLFGILLALPLAIPPYLSASALVGFLDLTGPVSRLAGTLVPGTTVHISPYGPVVLGLLLGFQLYPYVYLIVLPALGRGLGAPLDAARTLGRKGVFLFLSPGLGLLRPFAAAGIALVLMEALGEYGAAYTFGVPTLTYGMFRSWQHAWDLSSTVLIGLSMAVFAGALVLMEKLARKGRRYHQGTGSTGLERERIKPTGKAYPLVYGILVLAILPGLLVPVFQLFWWLLRYQQSGLNRVLPALSNTIVLIGVPGSAALALAIAGILSTRSLRPAWGTWAPLSTGAALSYATPSIVLALGIMQVFGGASGALAAGSTIVLGTAICIRFFSIAHNGLSSAWSHRIRPYLDAARVFEPSWLRQSLRISLPLMRPALASSALLLAIDIAKELNATLLLRPTGFDTLPSLIFEQATQELPHLAAIPGLTLIALTGVLAVILYRRQNHA
jgi:iron(III) transport system permease protein